MAAISAKTLKKVLGLNNNTNFKKIVGKNTGNVYWKSASEIWSHAEVYLRSSDGCVGIRIYDLVGNPMAGNTTIFSITYTLYKNSISSLNEIKSDTIKDTPNGDTGNMTFSTSVKPSYGVSYCAIVEIKETDKYAEWSETTESTVVLPWLGYATKPSSSITVVPNGTLSSSVGGTNCTYTLLNSSGTVITTSPSYKLSLGTYTVRVTPKDGYRWSGTTDDTSTITVNLYVRGSWTNASAGVPELMVGGEFGSYWTNPETGGTYSNRVIYACFYDYPNGCCTTNMRFTGHITLWQVGNSSPVCNRDFTTAPNTSGNLPISTNVSVVPGADYYAIVTINEANNISGVTNFRVGGANGATYFNHTCSYEDVYVDNASSTHNHYKQCTLCDARKTVGDESHTYGSWSSWSNTSHAKTGGHKRTRSCTKCGHVQTETGNCTHDHYERKYAGSKKHYYRSVCSKCKDWFYKREDPKDCTRPSGSTTCKYCGNIKSWH